MKKAEQQDFTRIWAPTLISYTRWVLKRALRLNIPKLYFLARDSHMGYLIAERLVKKEKLPIRCCYLEGSRYAWRMAEFSLPDTDIAAKICIGGIGVTLRKILRRGGLTEEEVRYIGDALGKKTELDRELNYEDTVRLKPVLAACEELVSLVRAHARAAYADTIAYFKQEGLYEAEAFAIVDSGWTGSLQQTLKRLLKSGNSSFQGRVQGFYFGLYELPKDADPKEYHTFYFRPYRDIIRKVHFSNCLFEAVCSAEQGMTLGYKRQDGRVLPVYETGENPNAKRIRENEKQLLKILEQNEDRIWAAPTKKQIEKSLGKMMSKPAPDEAALWGSYLFSDDVFNNNMQFTAAVFCEEDLKNISVIKRLLQKRRGKKNIKDSAWPEGSIVNAAGRSGYYLWHCRIYKSCLYLRKWIRHRH